MLTMWGLGLEVVWEIFCHLDEATANWDTKGAIESVHIKRVEFKEAARAFFLQEKKQTVCNNEVSVLCRVWL